MTINEQSVSIANWLAALWPSARLTADPEPLTGGFWASMCRLRVAGQPADVPGDLVLRIAPDAVMAAKETAVQRSLAETGFPTPRVRASGSGEEGLGGAWALMDLAHGASPLSGLDGAAALARAPRLFRRLPDLLAGPMARLHAVDPVPVGRAVAGAAPDAAWSVDALLGHFEAGARALGDAALLRDVRIVGDRRPAEGATVICHGDLHPFNLLVDDGHVTVLDWTASIRAEPAYDLAFTSFLLAHPPLRASRVMARVVDRAGRSLARRFLARYRGLSTQPEIGSVEWYGAAHGLRVLLESAAIGGRLDGHPFSMLQGAALDAVRRISG